MEGGRASARPPSGERSVISWLTGPLPTLESVPAAASKNRRSEATLRTRLIDAINDALSQETAVPAAARAGEAVVPVDEFERWRLHETTIGCRRATGRR